MKCKSVTTLLLAAALLLAGCSGVAEPQPSPETAATPSAEPSAPDTPEPPAEPSPMPEIPKTDFSLFRQPGELERLSGLPDVYTMLSGKKAETEYDRLVRMQELRDLFSYYMYGFWPDAEGETVTYDYSGGNLQVTVQAGGKSVTYDALVSVPKGAAPEGGYPVVITLAWAWEGVLAHGIPAQYALDNGYAVISFSPSQIAADDRSRTGVFYELYPYNEENVFEQTGTLMAWAWGGSKIIDALENGLGAELGVSAVNTAITGVSRYGKAAFVAGAFDERFRLTIPACSGAGGASMYRYNPAGNVYDYSSVGGAAGRTAGNPERLSNLQGGFPYWFNDTFLEFSAPETLPVDQHMLALLCSTNGRSLLIVSENDNDWIGPASTYATFAAALDLFTELGLEEHIAINLHWTGHAVLQEDLEKIIPFADYHFYGKTLPFDLKENLQTTVYDLEVNQMDDLRELLGR